jgi:hypothetical protein
MLKRVASAVLTVALLGIAPLAAQEGEVVRRGEPIGTSPFADLAVVLASPEAYTATPVRVEGVIVRNCTSKGCWMQLAPTAESAGLRVTFKDYGFFIPVNAKGMRALVEGVVELKSHTAEHARHLVEEGVRVRMEADGTATELTFVATGVELRR